MVSCFKPPLHAWKLWYVLYLIGCYSYLIYNAIGRYLNLKSNVFNHFGDSAWNESSMNFYLSMIIISIASILISVYLLIQPFDNYANDGLVIGKDVSTLKIAFENSNDVVKASVFRYVWRNFLPPSVLLHVISAYFLLLPIPVSMADLIYNNVNHKNLIWQSDLDYIFHPFNAQDHNDSNIHKPQSSLELFTLSPEIFNYMAALLFLAILYPATFWHVNSYFSIIQSVLLLVCNVQLILDYCALSVLYKIGINSLDFFADTPLSTSSLSDFLNLTVSPYIAMALQSVASLVMLSSHYTIFEYGYAQFRFTLLKYKQHLQPHGSNSTVSAAVGEKPKSSFRVSDVQEYVSYTISMVSIVIVTCLKVPALIDYFKIYRQTQNYLMLMTIVMYAFYVSFWLLIWLYFSLTSGWNFTITMPVQYINNHPSSVAGSVKSDSTCAARQPPLYAAYFSSGSSPHSIDCCSDSSKNSSELMHRNNYVYLQTSNVSQIPSINTITENNILLDSNEVSCSATPDANGAVMNGTPKYLMVTSNRRASLRTNAGTNCTNTFPQRQYLELSGESQVASSSELTRNGITRKSITRVTFKEQDDVIPQDSPESDNRSNNVSTDSGIIDSHRNQQIINHLNQPLLISNIADDLRDTNEEPTYLNQSIFAKTSPYLFAPAARYSPITNNVNYYRDVNSISFNGQIIGPTSNSADCVINNNNLYFETADRNDFESLPLQISADDSQYFVRTALMSEQQEIEQDSRIISQV